MLPAVLLEAEKRKARRPTNRQDRQDFPSCVWWPEDFWECLNQILQVFSADNNLELQSKHVLHIFKQQIFVGADHVLRRPESFQLCCFEKGMCCKHVIHSYPSHAYPFIYAHICSHMINSFHIISCHNISGQIRTYHIRL